MFGGLRIRKVRDLISLPIKFAFLSKIISGGVV